MIDQILKLQALGHSIRKISTSLGLSQNTVRRHLRHGESSTSTDAGHIEGGSLPKPGWAETLPWDEIRLKRRRGITAKQLYSDYEPAISYSRFCFHMRE